ncbi:unnamed protein product [Jaminaea pallidilutea]
MDRKLNEDTTEKDYDMEKLSIAQSPDILSKNNQDGGGLEPTITRLTVLGTDAGTVQNYNAAGQRLLLPSPSDDPNDPLNWSKARKWYITCLVCCAVFCCNFITAGPSIAILQQNETFGTPTAKTAYLFTAAALTQGLSLIVWAPITAKFGRRFTYVISFVIFTAFIFGAGATNTWGANMACRLILAFASGAGELLGPLTISDLFFVHERSLPFALYNSFLSVGVGLAFVIDGWVTEAAGWRAIYWVSGALIGTVTLLVIFTFPETIYRRGPVPQIYAGDERNIDYSRKESWAMSLRLVCQKDRRTKESWTMLFLRPLLLLTYPAVCWNGFVFAVTIGALVAVTSNVAPAYAQTYGFGPGYTGSAFVAAIIGSLFGIFGGKIADIVSDKETKKNGGRREPEMRLKPFLPALITTPLSLLLYGAGIQYKLHWIMPTIGLGLCNFSIVWGTSIAMVYMVDCIKPLAEEAVASVLAFKAIIGFVLAFYTNEWVVAQGYLNAYGEFASISSFFMLCVFIFIFWGKTLRLKALDWPQIRFVRWDEDRDDVIIED